MAMYEDLSAIDVLAPVHDIIPQLGFVIAEDGRIKPGGNWSFQTDTPWINSKLCGERNCKKWHIYFKHYNMISRNCFHCWKIVVKPKNLDQLFMLYDLQTEYVKKKDALACKCGIERRPYRTHSGWYAGFFYTPFATEPKEAAEHCRDIQHLVRKKLGDLTEVFLKRACTEFEDDFGPSESWEYPEWAHQREDLLDSVWDIPTRPLSEPEMIRTFIKKEWIRWGVSHGDKTALKYVGNMEHLLGTVTTHYELEAKSVDLKAKPRRSV